MISRGCGQPAYFISHQRLVQFQGKIAMVGEKTGMPGVCGQLKINVIFQATQISLLFVSTQVIKDGIKLNRKASVDCFSVWYCILPDLGPDVCLLIWVGPFLKQEPGERESFCTCLGTWLCRDGIVLLWQETNKLFWVVSVSLGSIFEPCTRRTFLFTVNLWFTLSWVPPL